MIAGRSKLGAGLRSRLGAMARCAAGCVLPDRIGVTLAGVLACAGCRNVGIISADLQNHTNINQYFEVDHAGGGSYTRTLALATFDVDIYGDPDCAGSISESRTDTVDEIIIELQCVENQLVVTSVLILSRTTIGPTTSPAFFFGITGAPPPEPVGTAIDNDITACPWPTVQQASYYSGTIKIEAV